MKRKGIGIPWLHHKDEEKLMVEEFKEGREELKELEKPENLAVWRRTGSLFKCLYCNYTCNAVYNGAMNIMKRAMRYARMAGLS
ncbi:MAG: hypothetical protein QW506_00615 [Thermoproteota archaeon]